jgi:hypothetical protein
MKALAVAAYRFKQHAIVELFAREVFKESKATPTSSTEHDGPRICGRRARTCRVAMNSGSWRTLNPLSSEFTPAMLIGAINSIFQRPAGTFRIAGFADGRRSRNFRCQFR